MTILNYQQSGSGQNIILIHGLFGSLENLNMVAKGLSDICQVTNIDVRNHGLSFHHDGMDYHDLAQDVIHIMDALSIEKTIVLGHSMGGKIAMQLALEHPKRVDKLIVADIAPIEYPPHHQQIIKGLQSLDLSIITTRKAADIALSEFVEGAGVRQFLLRNLVKQQGSLTFKCNLANIASSYHQIMSAYRGNNIFDKATLFIKGGNSDYIQAKDREIIMSLFPQSKAKIIQGAGHWLHAEKTIAFNKIIRDFVL